MKLKYLETAAQELKSQLFEQKGVQLIVKREDLNHPFISGNKWWKLKYNIEAAIQDGHHTLLTFGGAYSNHIFATAAAANELGLKSIGIIRGEETLPLNATLSFAKEKGMHLYYISREQYRRKNEEEFIKELLSKFGNFYLIPEGGTNEPAVKGSAELANKLHDEINFNYLCLAIGTGGTMAGMIEGLPRDKKIVGFSSLKGGEFLVEDIKKLTSIGHENWIVNTDYHFGGYAKSTNQLESFINEQKAINQLPLDKVYTSKMMFGVFDLIEKNYFEKGSKILILHTGGLQGNRNDK